MTPKASISIGKVRMAGWRREKEDVEIERERGCLG
jgi:hypothetical protein